MREKALLDTNIILDMAMPERPCHGEALMILDSIECKQIDAFVCATSLKDVYYILTEYMGEQNAREYVRAVAEVFDIASVDKANIDRALNSNEPDFEDGIIRACAELHDVDYIISRDQAAYEKSPVKRLDAGKYAQHLGWEEWSLRPKDFPKA